MARVWSMCLGTGRVQGGWPWGAIGLELLAMEIVQLSLKLRFVPFQIPDELQSGSEFGAQASNVRQQLRAFQGMFLVTSPNPVGGQTVQMRAAVLIRTLKTGWCLNLLRHR